MSTLTSQRSAVEWVAINQVIPNPLNPRKNDAIKTSEIQDIISKRGWEEPLTVYQKGKVYVVLAGHRRLYAAKQMKMKEVPVYVVETPDSHQEEIERIASLQRGRVDWTPYEWAKFTYERWIAWGKPPITQFSKQVNIGAGMVKNYITVMDYFKRTEIESGLQSGVYTITGLERLATWMIKVKKHKPEVVSTLTEEMIRKVMLAKIENNYVGREELGTDKFVIKSSEEDFIEFLTTTDMTLKQCQEVYGVDKNQKTFQGQLTGIGKLKKNVEGIDPKTTREKELAVENLENLRNIINNRLRRIRNSIK